MPIRDMQQRLTQVGVIRLGEKRISKNGNPYPAKLQTFRLTSPSRDTLVDAAKLFGGEVRDWPDAPSSPEFQLTTQTNELPVYVLPQRIDPNLELWGNRHRQRLCDGVVERIRNVPCLCEAAARQRYQRMNRPWPEDGRFQRDPRSDCKPTTRLSVVLRDVSDGQWKVEAHGWNAAAELPTKATVYLALAQNAVPAKLRLKLRTDAVLRIQPDGSEKVESREYVVPELDFGNLFTARAALTGNVDAVVQAALENERNNRPALEAGPVERVEPNLLDALWEQARAAKTVDELKALWSKSDDAKLREYLTERSKQFSQPATPPGPASPEPQADEPIDAEVAPDPDETWAAILREAGKRGWNTADVEKRYRDRMGHDPDESATGWKLGEFLAALKAGEVR